jgi:uncharacterized protein YwqG
MDDLGQLRRQLSDLSEHHLGPQLAARVMSLSRPAVRLIRSLAGSVADTGSRLGGDPVMAPGVQWPSWDGVPLSFLALIDLTEIARLDDSGLLPPAGFLNFFYDAAEQEAWGNDPAQSAGWRVVYVPPGDTELLPAPPGTRAFPAHGLRGVRTITLPGWEEEVLADWSREDGERLSGLDDAWREVVGRRDDWPGWPRHQIGGWPDLVQSSFWLEAQLASNGIHVAGPAGYRDPRAAQLRAGAASWRLLLQVDTDDDLGWMWGDAGMLYYTMRQEDLMARDFGRAWMVLQCY